MCSVYRNLQKNKLDYFYDRSTPNTFRRYYCGAYRRLTFQQSQDIWRASFSPGFSVIKVALSVYLILLSWTRLDSFILLCLTAYNDTMQEHCHTMHKCTPGKYYFQKKFTAPGHKKWSCTFDTSELGPCSGLEDETFGYNGTQPCVIIKMNRVHNKPSIK